MKMNRIELKMRAKEQINGNIGILLACSAIVYLISAAASILTYGIASVFIAPPMAMGLTLIFLRLADGIKPTVPDVFEGFNFYGKTVWLYVITQVFVLLWMLLRIIPGFIKALSYSMSTYILAENQNMTAREALNESKRMMYGHKMDLFVLELSFIPWMLLTYVTCGIAMIYVAPYMNMTLVNFYNEIKNEPKIMD